MTKPKQTHLYLLRHSFAESPAGGADFQRALTSEGVNIARALGRYLLKSSFNPSKVFCSTAVRAKETMQNLAEELEMGERHVIYKDEIYNASVRELLQLVNSIESDSEDVMIVGHNPTITYFAEYLTGSNIGNMDPCGLVTVSFEDIPWDEVSQNSGSLVSYFHPRNLNV